MALVRGSRGYAVSSLQEMFHQLGFYTETISDKYNDATEKAVARFQEANGLAVTGVADDRTLTIVAMKCAVVE